MERYSTFFGFNHFTKAINGCNISLTTYPCNSEYEDWHSHSKCSISLLIEGTYTEDLHDRRLVRRPGDIKFIHKGEQHRCYGFSPGTKKINLDFSDAQLKEVSFSEDKLCKLIHSSPYFKFVLTHLYQEVVNNNLETPASASIILHSFFNTKQLSVIEKLPPKWIRSLIELLHDTRQANFTLNEMSPILGVHPTTISRAFSQYFSTTLSRYLQMIKVDKALVLVRSSHLSLTEIAYACGFADQAHFTRTFKEMTGILPKNFRKI